jgi:hypothetical protein
MSTEYYGGRWKLKSPLTGVVKGLDGCKWKYLELKMVPGARIELAHPRGEGF